MTVLSLVDTSQTKLPAAELLLGAQAGKMPVLTVACKSRYCDVVPMLGTLPRGVQASCSASRMSTAKLSNGTSRE